MNTQNLAVSVNILGKDYRIGCEPGEEEAVRAAARLLDQRMQEIRGTGKVIGIERIAVMAALNLAHELLAGNSEGEPANALTRRVRGLRDQIEVALTESNQLEL